MSLIVFVQKMARRKRRFWRFSDIKSKVQKGFPLLMVFAQLLIHFFVKRVYCKGKKFEKLWKQRIWPNSHVLVENESACDDFCDMPALVDSLGALSLTQLNLNVQWAAEKQSKWAPPFLNTPFWTSTIERFNSFVLNWFEEFCRWVSALITSDIHWQNGKFIADCLAELSAKQSLAQSLSVAQRALINHSSTSSHVE